MTVLGRHRYGVAKNGWRQRHWLAFLQFDGQPALSGSGFFALAIDMPFGLAPMEVANPSPAKISKVRPNRR
jgi:hypothetical protein